MKNARKKYYLIVGITCISIMVIAVIGVVNYVSFYRKATWFDIFSNQQLPLYVTEELYVDSKENYYIGGYHNKYLQVFNSNGNYKMTISISSNSGSFFIDKNKFYYIDYDYGEYILDIEKKKILYEHELSYEKLDDFFAEYSQLAQGIFEREGKVYKLNKNKIEIKEGENVREVILKDIPIFPLPFKFWVILFFIGYLGFVLYLKIVFCR